VKGVSRGVGRKDKNPKEQKEPGRKIKQDFQKTEDAVLNAAQVGRKEMESRKGWGKEMQPQGKGGNKKKKNYEGKKKNN